MSDFLLKTPFGYYLRVNVPEDQRKHLGKRKLKNRFLLSTGRVL